MTRARSVLLLCAVSATVSASTSSARAEEISLPAQRPAPSTSTPSTSAAPPQTDAATPEPSGAAGRDMSAQRREASERYDRAFQLYDDGAYDAALSELERAYQLAPSFRILFNLGVMSLDVHDTAAAMAYFERYLAEAGTAISSDARTQVEEELRTLAGRVARVTIDVNVPGAEVSIDDRVVGLSPLRHMVRVNAGTRRISARANGWLPDSTLVSVAGGDEKHVVLRMSDLRSPPPFEDETSLNTFPWLGFSLTVTMAAGAVFSGVQALSAQHEFERKRRTLDVTAGALERADARALRWSLVADALSVAALGTGGYSLYLLLSRPDEKAERGKSRANLGVVFTPSGVALRGRF